MLRRAKEGAIRCSGCKKKRETGSEERKRASVPSKCNGRVAEAAAEVLAEEAGVAAERHGSVILCSAVIGSQEADADQGAREIIIS